MSARKAILLLALLAACGEVNLGDPLTAYYPEGGTAPEISDVTPASEVGNGGGQTATIQGSGFGTDPDVVTVVIGNRNAEILDIADDEMLVRVPHGPFEGGAVDVKVGTSEGQAVSSGGYTFEVPSVTEDEVAYILAINATASCLGGLENDAPNALETGCADFAYMGLNGITGGAEFLDLIYPRFHTPNLGFWGGGDSSEGWVVEAPGQASFVEGIDSFYNEDIIDHFTLTNPALDGMTWCADIGRLGTYSYAGEVDEDGEEIYAAASYDPVNPEDETERLNIDDDVCDAKAAQVQYPLDTLEFCRPPETGTLGETYSTAFRADWPLTANFFSTFNERDGELDGDTPLIVSLDVPQAKLEGVLLDLPERALFEGTLGFAYSSSGSSRQRTLWGVGDLQVCNDSDEDGEITLADTALQWSWEPAKESDAERLAAIDELNGEGVVTDVNTTVKVSLVYLNIGWLSGEGTAMQASIEVPDEDGVVSLPGSVLYQFPNLSGQGASAFKVGDPLINDYGILIATIDRVTEYRMYSEALGHDVIFAYDVSDLGFFNWSNPMDAGECGDCVDNDGDGDLDAEDSNCEDGDVE